MPAVYTRTGDTGSTGLFGGSRVAKQSLRVEAYGTVDEANAALGQAKAGLEPGPWRDRIHGVQQRLFVLGAELASDTAGAQHAGGPGLGAAGGEEDVGDADGGGGAQDGAEVAGVLHPIEHHKAVRGQGCAIGQTRGVRLGQKIDDCDHARGAVHRADVGKERIRQLVARNIVRTAPEQIFDFRLRTTGVGNDDCLQRPLLLQRGIEQMCAIKQGLTELAPLTC